MSLPHLSAPGTDPLDRTLPRGVALVACLAAATISAAYLLLGLLPKNRVVALGAAALFGAWCLVGVLRTLATAPGRPTWRRLLPWLVFGAPTLAVIMALRARTEPLDLVGLRELAQVGGTLGVAHLVLRRLAGGGAAARAEDAASPQAAFVTAVNRGLYPLAAGLVLLATLFLALRFQVYQAAGHPEDTAFLWDCFRQWRAGHGPVSPWAVAWGHRYPTHYFALHFSPALYLFFALTALLPRLATLLALQNLAVTAGLFLMARTLARPAGARAELFPGAAAWSLALLLAFPPLNSALRTDLHPILWSLPLVALVHAAYDRRRPVPFLVAGLLLFTVREDLGYVWGMYAPLAFLEGRRTRGDLFWLLAPLLGFAGTLTIQQAVIPRFGVGESAFFQLVFGTTATNLPAFLLGLAGQPLELLRRLFRPGNLVLLARVAATGLGVPLGTWRWLPALPLLVVFSLVEPGTQLLHVSGHYVTVPALVVAGAALAVWLRRLAAWPAPSRTGALVMLLALGLCQPAPPELPPLERLRGLAATRRNVAEDVALPRPGQPVWYPGNLLLAAPDPALAVPIHRMAVMTLDPGAPGLPAQALIPNVPEMTADRVRLLSGRYGPWVLTARGHDYDLYELERR